MKNNPSSKKIEILQSENKRPPKKLQTKKEEKQEVKEITPEQEKNYLKGEPHIDETSTSEKEVIYPPIEDKLMTEPKQIKVFKPRENYLKEKITKLNYDEKLLNNIQKDLGTQVEDIKTEIKKDNILITEAPKDLNKYLKSSSGDKHIVKYSNEDYEIKKKYKIIKELKEEETTLKKKLNKFEENEALLNNEGFINLSKSSEGITKLDQSIKDQHIKTIKNKKKDIYERLKEIEFRIDLMLKENNQNLTKRELLENYRENFERDKEIIEARANKYLKESKLRNKRLANDINQIVEKRKKEIEQKEKDEQLQKEKIRKDFIEKEKAIEQKRLKEKEEIMLKYKPFIKEKNNKTEKDYLFGIYDKKFQESEQRLIKKVNYEKKIKSKTVTSEELQDFANKIEEKKEQIKKKKEIKNKDELEKFVMARNFKPSYIGHYTEIAEEEYNKFREKEKARKDEILALKGLKEEFSKNKVRQPSINEVLKKQRMDKIVELENPKLVQIKDTLVKRNKKVKLKKRDLTWMNKLYKTKDKADVLNNSEVLQNIIIRRPKKIRFFSAYKKIKENEEEEYEDDDIFGEENGYKRKKIKKDNDKPTKKIDYLPVLREEKKKKEEEREKKRKELEELKKSGMLPPNDENNTDQKKKKNKKGKNNEIQDDENIIQKISNARIEAEKLDKKAEMEEKLLKVNGGVENDPNAGQKLSGYLMDSIKAKLNILNQLYKS